MTELTNPQTLKSFLQRNQLAEDYLIQAEQWFTPLVRSVAHCVKRHQGSPIIIGINGCQGSGKSTLADYVCTSLAQAHNIEAVTLSLDDFYLLKSERQTLATNVHPLLATRGVPGTHDTKLALQVLSRLKETRSGSIVLPRFDKTLDDRVSASNTTTTLPVQVIIFEGWCVGAEPQKPSQLVNPINQLEREHDSNGQWRAYVNHALATDYAKLFALLDYKVMLKAPSFDCVFQWRLEQEKKMAAALDTTADWQQRQIMDAEQVRYFIQHYQRVTEHSFSTLPGKVHHLYELSNHRKIISHSQPLNSSTA